MAGSELHGSTSDKDRGFRSLFRDRQKKGTLRTNPNTLADPNISDKEASPELSVRLVGFENNPKYFGTKSLVTSEGNRVGRFKAGGDALVILGLFVEDETQDLPVRRTTEDISKVLYIKKGKVVDTSMYVGSINQTLRRSGYELHGFRVGNGMAEYEFQKLPDSSNILPKREDGIINSRATTVLRNPHNIGQTFDWYEPSPAYSVRQSLEKISLFDASDERPKRKKKILSHSNDTSDSITKIPGVPLVSPEEIAKREAKYRAQANARVVQVIDDHEFPPTPPVVSAEVHPNQRHKELLARIPIASIVALYLSGELITYDGLKTYVQEVANTHPALAGKNISPTIPFASDLSIGISTYVIRLLRESQSPNAKFLPGEQNAVAELTELQKTGIRFAESLSSDIQMEMFRLQREANIREPQAQKNNQKF